VPWTESAINGVAPVLDDDVIRDGVQRLLARVAQDPDRRPADVRLAGEGRMARIREERVPGSTVITSRIRIGIFICPASLPDTVECDSVRDAPDWPTKSRRDECESVYKPVTSSYVQIEV
jgi:hypothetical protein